MDAALVLSGALLGLAGSPHCAAMCGPSCAALTGAGGASREVGLAFLLARTGSYALVGALAAGGMGAASVAAQAAPVLRPLWVMLHIAALALGAWMLLTARQPAWLGRLGTTRPGTAAGAWQPVQGPRRSPAATPLVRALLGGSAWVAWPCGLLQSALVVAALGSSPTAGAASMTAFALASAPALAAAPWVWRRLVRAGGDGQRVVGLAIRGAGALLVVASLVALAGDRWAAFKAYCGL